MKATAKDLRFHTGSILDSVSRGEEVIITYHGKEKAKLVPLQEAEIGESVSQEGFGMWKDRDDFKDPAEYVRSLRKGRF